MNKEFKEQFNNVKKIIFDNDPVGLIDGGAPDDEYDSVILEILSVLQRLNNVEEITKEVEKIFIKNFGEDLVDTDMIKLIIEKIII